MKSPDTDTLYVGLDVGGSNTEVYACRDREAWNEPLYYRRGPGANLKRVGLNECSSTIAGLIRDLAQNARPDRLVACAGVAGASTAEERERIEQAIGAVSSATVRVASDARLALEAAFPDESGIAVIAGTGSIVYGRTVDRSLVRAGGWGSVIGDEGSGYALGVAGLRAVAHATDGGPTTALQQLYAQKAGLSTRAQILRYVYGGDARIQELAPLVLRAADEGDPVAEGLVRTHIRALTRQVLWLVDPNPTINKRIAGFGGLFQHALYRTVIEENVLDLLGPQWSFTVSKHAPAVGALYLATRMGLSTQVSKARQIEEPD